MTAEALHALLVDTLGKTLEGYKGGDFLMDADTPLWCSPYGDASGLAIVRMEYEDGLVQLFTKKVD
jgi:hypothetical protein